jgi:uncharacterized membrane protein
MADRPENPPLARVLEHNIASLLARRRAQERARSRMQRASDAITRFSGSLAFVALHAIAVAAWVLLNVGGIPGVRPFDPTFVILATVASVEAIFLSTFVLITQNRMAAAADQRADLDLQISLLAEHEVTRLVRLVTAIADRMGIEESRAEDLPELARDVEPGEVLDRLERARTADRGAGAVDAPSHRG